MHLNFTGYDEPGINFGDMGTGVYRGGGRGYPDLAAVGDAYVVRFNGTWCTIGGTSLSAPVVATMLTLVTEERIAAGKPTIGFVNPILVSGGILPSQGLLLMTRLAMLTMLCSMPTQKSSTTLRTSRTRLVTRQGSWPRKDGIQSLDSGKSGCGPKGCFFADEYHSTGI